MSITLRAYDTAGVTVGAAATAITLNAPAGVVSTDVVLAIITGNFGSGAITPPAGWTLVGRRDQLQINTAVYWALGSVASYAFTIPSTTSFAEGTTAAYSGVDTTTPMDATATVTGSDVNQLTPAGASITTVSANTVVVVVFGTSAVQVSGSSGAPLTDEYNLANHLFVGDAPFAAAGSTGAFSFSASTTTKSASVTAALRPAAVVNTFDDSEGFLAGTMRFFGPLALATSVAASALTASLPYGRGYQANDDFKPLAGAMWQDTEVTPYVAPVIYTWTKPFVEQDEFRPLTAKQLDDDSGDPQVAPFGTMMPVPYPSPTGIPAFGWDSTIDFITPNQDYPDPIPHLMRSTTVPVAGLYAVGGLAFVDDSDFVPMVVALALDDGTAWTPPLPSAGGVSSALLSDEDGYTPQLHLEDEAGVSAFVVWPPTTARAVADDDGYTPQLGVEEDAGLWPLPLAAATPRQPIVADDDFIAPIATVALDDGASWSALVVLATPRVLAITDDDLIVPQPVVTSGGPAGQATALVLVDSTRTRYQFTGDELPVFVAPTVVDDDAGWSAPILTAQPPVPVALVETDSYQPTLTLEDEPGQSSFIVLPPTTAKPFTDDDLYPPTLTVEEDVGVSTFIVWPVPQRAAVTADDEAIAWAALKIEDEPGVWRLSTAPVPQVAPFIETDAFVAPVQPPLADDDTGLSRFVQTVQPPVPAAFTSDDYTAPPPPYVDDDAAVWRFIVWPVPQVLAATDDDVPPALAVDDADGFQTLWLDVPPPPTAIQPIIETDQYAPALLLDDEPGWQPFVVASAAGVRLWSVEDEWVTPPVIDDAWQVVVPSAVAWPVLAWLADDDYVPVVADYEAYLPAAPCAPSLFVFALPETGMPGGGQSWLNPLLPTRALLAPSRTSVALAPSRTSVLLAPSRLTVTVATSRTSVTVTLSRTSISEP